MYFVYCIYGRDCRPQTNNYTTKQTNEKQNKNKNKKKREKREKESFQK